jgi:hypothetical protein
MRVIFLGLISINFLFTSCSQKLCTDNISVNRDVYRRYLIILKESKRPHKLVMPKEIEEAMLFLEVVSGITSRAKKQENINYRNKSDFNADIKAWEQWYKANKCKLTLKYVDSMFNSVKLTR